MARNSPDAMTLRDRIAAAIRLTREAAEHVERGLIPKVRDLREATRPDRPAGGVAEDKAVHAQAAAVLDADHHAAAICESLTALCESIRRSAGS